MSFVKLHLKVKRFISISIENQNELNFCKEFGSEDKLYCGTYCYNSCSTFSKSESGAETRSQNFQFLIDILNQTEPSCWTSFYRHLDLYTLQHVVEFVIQALFLEEKVLLLPVVYEKYKSMNFNAEYYKFSFTEKNFKKFALLLTFFQSLIK